MLHQAAQQALSAAAGQTAIASVAARSRPRPLGSTAGFTLLEIIITLAVLGILFVGLAQGTRFALFAWDAQTRLVEHNGDLDAVDRILRSIIERAKPGSKWEPLEFVGTAHSVTFTSSLPVPMADFPSHRADVELGVDVSHRLLLVWTPHLHALRIGRPSRALTSEILQGVERLELSYWPAAQGGTWTQAWHDPLPPRLVRVRIIFSDTSHPPWPDIVAAPRLDRP